MTEKYAERKQREYDAMNHKPGEHRTSEVKSMGSMVKVVNNADNDR